MTALLKDIFIAGLVIVAMGIAGALIAHYFIEPRDR